MGAERLTPRRRTVLGTAALYVVLSALPAAAGPVASRAGAAARAVGYTGFPADAVTSIARRVVTDLSSPVLDISSRRVWEVVFSDVNVSVSGPGGKGGVTVNLPSVRVWLDAQTGALVKAATPAPAHGGLSIQTGEKERALVAGNGISLKESPALPAKPLAAALAIANTQLLGSVVQAKEIVAYFGLMTDTMPITEAVYDKPAWLIYLGGVNQPFSSSGPSGNPSPPGPATEALVMLDATTGEWHETWLAGRALTPPPAAR
jgi:hypothetical protein